MTSALRSGDGRLRSGWRVLIVLVAVGIFLLISSLALGLVIGLVCALTDRDLDPAIFHGTLGLGCASVIAVAGTGLVFLFRRVLDRRPIRSFGFGPVRVEVALWIIGLAGGAGLITIQVCIVGALGGLHWTGPPSFNVGMALLYILILLPPTLWEEVFVRGYLLTNLREGLGSVPAVVISSIIFALMHLENPGQEGLGLLLRLLVLLNICLAGILLGIIYLRTRSIPAVWGVHFGWNLFLGPVFGIQVSGMRFDALVPVGVDLVPQIGGGAFGIEGGLICTGVVGLAILAAWALLPTSRTP